MLYIHFYIFSEFTRRSHVDVFQDDVTVSNDVSTYVNTIRVNTIHVNTVYVNTIYCYSFIVCYLMGQLVK